MRVGRSLSGLCVLGVLIAAPAMADEIIYFTNGTTLPITSHTVEKDMISVELGANSKMGFPVSMVDKIESSGQSVYLNPVYHPANQALAGPVGGGVSNAGSYPITGTPSMPARWRNQLAGKSLGDGAAQHGSAVGATGSARLATKVGNRSALADSLQRSGLPAPITPPGQGGAGRRGGMIHVDVRRDGTAAPTPTTAPAPGDTQPPAEEPPPDTQTPPEDNPPADPPSGS